MPIYQASADQRISYELRPSITENAYGANVTTDARGLRATRRNGTGPPIVLQGDSVAFGFGVDDEETMPAFLQQRLPEYTVLNAAVAGYNVEQQSAQYRQKLRALTPKVLVLLFVFNDFERPDRTRDQESMVSAAREPAKHRG